MASDLLGAVMGAGSLIVGIIFVVYGVKAGIVDQSITASLWGGTLEGKEAVWRGVLYVVVGSGFLAVGITVAVSLLRKYVG